MSDPDVYDPPDEPASVRRRAWLPDIVFRVHAVPASVPSPPRYLALVTRPEVEPASTIHNLNVLTVAGVHDARGGPDAHPSPKTF